MLKQLRIIPKLDIKGPCLVKGIHLEGLRVLGDPIEFAQSYYQNGADELIIQDVTASLYQTKPQLDLIQKIARNVFIPITVGGGVSSIEDIRSVLQSGADKVSINSYNFKNLQFLKQAAKTFGSSTIVAGLEVIKQKDGNYQAVYLNGRMLSEYDAIDWAKRLQDQGAGEIILTSVDQDGTGRGFDKKIIELINNAVNIPVIAHGGARNFEDVKSLYHNLDVSGIALASCLHYSIYKNLDYSNLNDKQGNLTFLQEGQDFTCVDNTDLKKLKSHLLEDGFLCRNVE